MANFNKEIVIVQGETKDIIVRLLNKDTKDPLDLTGATLTAKLPKEDGTALSITPSVLSAVAGKLKVAISDTNSALLKADENQSFEVHVTTASSAKHIVQFLKILTVKPKLF